MVDCILLISGSSSRMGREKALLPFSYYKSFVSQLIDTYSNMKNSTLYILVNRNNEELIKKELGFLKKKIEFLMNPKPEDGRLSSILIGLNQLQEGRGAFIQNIDNPFVSIQLLDEMLKNYSTTSFVVPQYKGKNGHPLLLGAELVKELKRNANTIFDLKNFLNSKEKQVVFSNDKAILANINTMQEYRKWFPDIEF